MKDEKSGNPLLSKINVQDASNPMTMAGTSAKSLILLAILFAGATISYTPEFSSSMAIGAMLGAFILAMVSIFKQNLSPYLAPAYAFLKGIALGYISVLADMKYPGVAMQSIMGTFGVFLVMAVLYSKKIIVVNDKFMKIVFSCMVGILIIYLTNVILALFGVHMPVVNDSSPWGIVFSVVVVIVAAMNLAIDFEVINQNVENNAPKYMEWYCSLGLLITLVWLYLEMLRLLQKLRK